MARTVLVAACAAVGLATSCARASQTPVEKLYTVEAIPRSATVETGGRGTVSLAISPKAGAHVSPDAPLKATLSAKNLKLDKDALGRGDLVPGTATAPRFEVGFAALDKGQGMLEAELVFFICTDKLCERQVKKLSASVSVR